MSGPGLQTTLLNIVSLSEFTDLVDKKFELSKNMVETNIARQLFIYSDEGANTGNTRRFDEVDVQTFGRLKEEGADAKKASVGVGYYKIMTAKRIAMEIDITWEMRKYNKKPEVISQLTSLNQFGPQRLELDLSHVFTFCSSSSYVDMDGTTVDVTTGDSNPLVYATKDLAFSSETYRNRVSGDPIFSQGGLESAEKLAVSDILSNFGERRTLNFNKIVTTDDPNTCRTVKQVLQSTADIDAPQAGVMNTFKDSYMHVKLPWLATDNVGGRDSTKRRWWFTGAFGQGASASWQAYLGIWEQPNLKSPAQGNNGEDVHNDNWTYGCRMSYGQVTLSGRGLIGSLPTS